tara:strand:+ start:3551 stop:3697 length:147 start_codon:yes stop_codon:yes gene_type:complete
MEDNFIVLPIYYQINGKYDFDEMANELESRILASLGNKVKIIIKEKEE